MVQRRTIEVTGMSCNGCERTVENALKNVTSVRRADANHESGTVEVVIDDGVSDDTLEAAILDAGYEVVA